MFTQPFIRAQIKVNIKAPRLWPLCGEFTGDRWIPRTNGQLRGKCFHLMTSSWYCGLANADLGVPEFPCSISEWYLIYIQQWQYHIETVNCRSICFWTYCLRCYRRIHLWKSDMITIIGALSQYQDCLSRYRILIIKIRWSWDHFIFIVGMPILVKHLYIETGSWT